MPLIIILLIVIICCSHVNGMSSNNLRQKQEMASAMRKTNAELELSLVNKYYRKKGKNKKYPDLGTAIELAKKDLCAMGYEPCIPRDAYDYDPELYEDDPESYYEEPDPIETNCSDCTKFDSRISRMLREDFDRMSKTTRAVFKSEKERNKRREEYFNNNFPKTTREYNRYLGRSTVMCKAIPIGRYISYPGLGTCEIVALDFDKLKQTIKSVKTGETKTINFGDINIIEL